eukprot:15450421-Alexandrium_andersonii.AAC.1
MRQPRADSEMAAMRSEQAPDRRGESATQVIHHAFSRARSQQRQTKRHTRHGRSQNRARAPPWQDGRRQPSLSTLPCSFGT